MNKPESKSFRAMLVEQVRDGEENPFWTLEALGEHVQASWGALGKSGLEVWSRDEHGNRCRPTGDIGSITYHLRCIDEYQQKLLNLIDALLPELSASDDGEEAALLLIRDELTALASVHQRDWDEFQATLNKPIIPPYEG